MRQATFIVLLLACPATWAHKDAWWITARVEPKGTVYDSVPVDALAVPLKTLTLLDCDGPTPSFTPEQCVEARAYGARFEVIGDFNHDHQPDIARVGVAELKDGSRVRLLLIGTQGKPEQHQVFDFPENGFSALFGDARLTWH